MTHILTCTCSFVQYHHVHACCPELEKHAVTLTTTALQTPSCCPHPSTALSSLTLHPRPKSSSPPPHLVPAGQAFPSPRR